MCSVGHKSVLPNRNRQMTYMHRGNCRSSVCRSKGGRPVGVVVVIVEEVVVVVVIVEGVVVEAEMEVMEAAIEAEGAKGYMI